MTPPASAERAPRPDRLRCFDPASGELLGDVILTAPDQVAGRASAAREAQRAWAATSFGERRRVLRLLLERILDRSDELCELIVRDTGKTRENALLGELWPVCEKLRWTIAHGEEHLLSERASSGILVNKRARIDYEPLGVVGIICPWNYPFQNILGPVIPALMAGNACLVKPSEWVAWSSSQIEALLAAVLEEAGHSPRLVQLVYGLPEVGRALIRSGVEKIIFTGSVQNGRQVIAESAALNVPLVLELGGKDALIVCDDAALERAAHAAMAGVFINAGQNCLAAERILVFDGIYDRFERRVLELTRALRQGAPRGGLPVDVGAMVSPLQLVRVEQLVKRALEQGARLLHQGERPPGPGQFYPPTILAEVRPGMEIMQEELFGPVMLLCRVAGEAEAVEVANGTGFGLGCTLLTRDARRARRMASAMATGGVSINDFGLTYMAQDLPFGGVKASGFGRLNGREGLRAMTRVKAVLEDRGPLQVPARLYPVRGWHYPLVRRLLEVLYRPGLVAKARAALGALGALPWRPST